MRFIFQYDRDVAAWDLRLACSRNRNRRGVEAI